MIAKIVSGFIDCPDIIRVRFYPPPVMKTWHVRCVWPEFPEYVRYRHCPRRHQRKWKSLVPVCLRSRWKFFSVDSIADGNRTVGHLKINCYGKDTDNRCRQQNGQVFFSFMGSPFYFSEIRLLQYICSKNTFINATGKMCIVREKVQ